MYCRLNFKLHIVDLEAVRPDFNITGSIEKTLAVPMDCGPERVWSWLREAIHEEEMRTLNLGYTVVLNRDSLELEICGKAAPNEKEPSASTWPWVVLGRGPKSVVAEGNWTFTVRLPSTFMDGLWLKCCDELAHWFPAGHEHQGHSICGHAATPTLPSESWTACEECKKALAKKGDGAFRWAMSENP